MMITPHGLVHPRLVIEPEDRDEEITRLKLENMKLRAVVRQTIGCLNDAQNILKNSGLVE